MTYIAAVEGTAWIIQSNYLKTKQSHNLLWRVVLICLWYQGENGTKNKLSECIHSFNKIFACLQCPRRFLVLGDWGTTKWEEDTVHREHLYPVG